MKHGYDTASFSQQPRHHCAQHISAHEASWLIMSHNCAPNMRASRPLLQSCPATNADYSTSSDLVVISGKFSAHLLHLAWQRFTQKPLHRAFACLVFDQIKLTYMQLVQQGISRSCAVQIIFSLPPAFPVTASNFNFVCPPASTSPQRPLCCLGCCCFCHAA